MARDDYTIGIDVGGTKILAIAESESGEQLSVIRTDTPVDNVDNDAFSDAVGEIIGQIDKSVGDYELAGVGVGLAGLVATSEVFLEGPHLPGVKNLNLPVELARRGVVKDARQVLVENDANMAAWAEFKRGAGQKKLGMVLVTFGTGIGGGFVVNGSVFRGIRGFAGEIGHHVVCDNGFQCECGRKGCWEQYASGNALGRLGQDAAEVDSNSLIVELAGGELSAVRGIHVCEAARKGDTSANLVIKEYGRWIAEGLANISNILDVDCFVLGGGVVESKDVVVDPILNAYEAIAYKRECEIVVAQLGELANAIGAADLSRAHLAG